MTEAMTMNSWREGTGIPVVREALREFAEVRGGTIRMTGTLTEEQAQYKPDAGQWSVAQNLDHLLVSEALYRRQLQRLVHMAREGKRTRIDLVLGKGELSLPFVPQALMPLIAMPMSMMNMFIPAAVRETMIRFPIVKARNPKLLEPAAAKPISELREQLAESLAVTEGLLAGELPKNIGRVTMSHPLFGRNNIANVLALLTAHERRHAGQISGLPRSAGFPRAGAIV